MSFQKKVKSCISEFDAKLERLVDIFIDRRITQEEYAKRKAKLLNDKKDLEGSLEEIEKSSGGWLEPAKQFVTTCNQAGSVAWQEILSPKKDFLNLCGSNLKLKDTSLLVSYKKPYDLVAQSQGRLNWRTRLQPIRTASEVPVKIIIEPLQRTPLYQRVAKKVEELSLLGMSSRKIAKSLNINRKTVRNAYKLSYASLRKTPHDTSLRAPKGRSNLKKEDK